MEEPRGLVSAGARGRVNPRWARLRKTPRGQSLEAQEGAMRKTLVLLLGLAALGALAVPALGLGGGDGRKVLDANVLSPVIAPYTGTANPIRGVPGGGLPWELTAGDANLRANGRLHLRVKGLVLAR